METIQIKWKKKQQQLFKSYYVVWKQKIMRKDREKFKKFKSYYVVWKPKEKQKVKETEEDGLNRTMQYGNRVGQNRIPLMTKKFKSYYVVWKPENENNIGRSIEV